MCNHILLVVSLYQTETTIKGVGVLKLKQRKENAGLLDTEIT